MIRQNYSLANELKTSERKQQNKVQQRQKRQFKLDKLSKSDPIKLYGLIERLEQNNDKTQREILYLKNLKDDWEFINKNGLHKDKIEPFLQKREQEEKEKIQANNKLWGRESVYFNPELNPLGKVPGANLLDTPIRQLPNYTKPLKSHLYKKYDKDPIIDKLGIVMPEGEPPRFYKMVQNVNKYSVLSNAQNTTNEDAVNEAIILSTETKTNMFIPSNILKKPMTQTREVENTDNAYKSDSELAPEEEDYLISIGKLPSKRPRLN